MKNTLFVFLAILSVLLAAFCTSHAASFPYTVIEIDTQNKGQQFTIDREFYGSTPFIQFTVTENGTAFDLTGWTFDLKYGYSRNASAMVSFSSTNFATITNNIIQFNGTTNFFFEPRKGYYIALQGTYTNGGYSSTFAEGTMDVYYTPAGDPNVPSMQDAITFKIVSMETFSAFTNAQHAINTNLQSRATSLEGYTNFAATAYSWGDHAGLYPAIATYTAATQSLWSAISSATPGGYVSVSNAAVTAYGWGDHATNGYLTVEQDTNALHQLEVETNRAMLAEALLYPRSNPSNWVTRAEATNGMQVAGNYATGTPVYVEQDTNALAKADGVGISLTNTQGDVSSLIGNISNSYVMVDGEKYSFVLMGVMGRPNYEESVYPSTLAFSSVGWGINSSSVYTNPSLSYIPPSTGWLDSTGGVANITVEWFSGQNVALASNVTDLAEELSALQEAIITGATITNGADNSVTTNAGILAITVKTNAPVDLSGYVSTGAVTQAVTDSPTNIPSGAALTAALAGKIGPTNEIWNLSGVLDGTNKNAAVYFDFTNNVLRATVTP